MKIRMPPVGMAYRNGIHHMIGFYDPMEIICIKFVQHKLPDFTCFFPFFQCTCLQSKVILIL